MANYYSLCLVGAMDRLWFHQIILFSETISDQKTPETSKPNSVSLAYSSLLDEGVSSDISLLADVEILSDSSPSSPTDDSNNEDTEKNTSQKEKPTRLNRSHSSSPSPSTQKRPKRLRNSGANAIRRLQKSMSCKTLGDLELEEVKGFMDLGFIFKKEHLSPRMMSVVPGLQRLSHKNKQSSKLTNDAEVAKDDETEEGKEKRVTRPYLSEAWLINRPDSPLLNLKIPSASTADDMKKHIKFWARTVASVIHEQES
ncbi:uncharacterized protein LOC115952668 [Quercus lobata]|uniref:Uncharacterized protein n=1 Tax=Quercus lobata TaxID=97700 RepID=A0A7N2M5K4_QUELO|nr:uncharacterized protein LOC115952668 [Quercus lobata]